MKYQAYKGYELTDTDWLGEAPSHWKSIAIGRLFRRTKRTDHVNKELLSVYRDYGVIPKSSRDDNNNKPSEDLTPYQLVEPNDLVMNKMKTWQGSIAISEYEGIVSPAYFVYQPIATMFDLAYPKYIHYLLRNPMYIAQYLRRSKGIRVSQWDLDPDEFQKIELLLPDKEEQIKIFQFLDHETAKIDTLIKKQQQLIKLLKEKRQALINHVVTKGLNLNAPMRDSGVEWLGEVPEDWTVSALKYHVDTVNGFGFSSSDICEEGVPFIRAGNIKKKSITPTDLYLPQRVVDRYKRVILFEGDIVISMVGSDPRILESAVGQVGVVPKSMGGSVPNQNVVILREKSDSILKQFLFYTLCSEPYRNHLNVFSHKLANQSIISSSLIVNAKFILPSTDEQKKIIGFLDHRLEKIDEVVEKNYGSLELLKERRTALISAAVTGKIDVRNWVAPAHPCARDMSASCTTQAPNKENKDAIAKAQKY